MKRLLSYLVIVITLGLTIKDNAETSINYVFCKSIAYGSVNIQLNKCSSGYISVDVDKYVFTKLLGDTEDEDYKNKQDQFNGEMERLLDEFKVYNLDVNLILETIKKNKQLNKYFSNLTASAKNRLLIQTENSKKIAKAKKPSDTNNIPDKIYVRFCSRGSDVVGNYDYKITLAPNVCNNLWGTFGSKWQITYDEWQESDKGYSSFPGKMDICYRPAANKITTNADKEHVNITYPGTSCIKSPRKFYKLKYLGDVSSSDKTAIFVLASSNISIAEKPKQKPEKTDQDLAKLEEEKRKIEEEKRKIEEEKRKIAEAKKKQEEEEKILIIGSGTGFFVNDQGHIITNNHVVEICKMMAAEIDGDPKIFKILATDEQNDLALIKGDYVNKNCLNLSTRGAVFGEDILAFGYPLDTELSSSVKLTRGIVSSLSGPKNNISQIQIDAAIQPGNSGGPVLNYEGQVVGVASSGLNKWYMIEKSEYIPENVNFAVAAPTLLSFLKANNVNFGEKKIEVSKTKELAKIGMPSTIQLLCLNTKSTHEKHKKNKKYSDVLLKQVIELR